MSLINSTQRNELFSSYPTEVQNAFESRKTELYNDSKVWDLLLAMNRMSHGTVPTNNKTIVTNQGDDDARWLNGIPEDTMKEALRIK